MPDLMDEIVSLAKRRGFAFQSSEIYGGLRSSWDYGPLGVELKNNIKQAWWRTIVQRRDDVVGLDAAVIMSPKVWEASGHLEVFADPLVECLSCHQRFREDHLPDPRVCPNCGSKGFTDPRNFNLMFKTHMGPIPDDDNEVFLRPETAQAMFVDFAQSRRPRARSPVRDRADRQVVPQRDHAGQLRVPHAGVRADGDGVLRGAGNRRGLAPVLDRHAHAVVSRPRAQARAPSRARA